MSTLNRYPDRPAYTEMARTRHTENRGVVPPLLPLPQPGVIVNEGRLSLDEFKEAIRRAVEVGCEEYTFLYARPVGATLVYGQFGLSSSIRARAYCVTNSLVPSIDGSTFRQAGYRRLSTEPASAFPSNAIYEKAISPKSSIIHDLELPNAGPLDRELLSRAAIEKIEGVRSRISRLIFPDMPNSDDHGVIAPIDLKKALNRGFRSVFESTVSRPGSDWTNGEAPIDWNDGKVSRVWEGMQMAISGAETIADRINNGFDLTDSDPGVTVAIPLLKATDDGDVVHPLHEKIVGDHSEPSFENILRWHAKFWLPRYGVTVDEAFSQIMQGKTLEVPNF